MTGKVNDRFDDDTRHRFFAVLKNPSNGARFALTEDGQTVAMYPDTESCAAAARRTLFGQAGCYEVFDTRASEDGV